MKLDLLLKMISKWSMDWVPVERKGCYKLKINPNNMLETIGISWHCRWD